MRVFKFAAVGATAIAMVAATSAIAAQPLRSAASLPANTTVTAKNFRTATPLKHKSSQSDDGTPVVGYVLAAVVGAGIIAATIAATNDDNSNKASSPG